MLRPIFAVLLLIFRLGATLVMAQDQLPKPKFEPFIHFQLWGIYSFDHEIYSSVSKEYEQAPDRLNLMLRRTRIGVRSHPTSNIFLQATTLLDNIGKDPHSSLLANSNSANSPSIGVVDFFARWQLLPQKEYFFLTVGYFRPNIGRESLTPGFNINTLEKSRSQNYMRRHLTSRDLGRATGVNLGGLFYKPTRFINYQYNVGLYTPVAWPVSASHSIRPNSPMLTARWVVELGDPEMTKYHTVYQINYFNRRKGASIAFAGAWEGPSELYQNNFTFSTDLLLNYGPLNFDAEYNLLTSQDDQKSIYGDIYSSSTGHLRAGYNLKIMSTTYLEPVIMYTFFVGALDAKRQTLAQNVGAPAGTNGSLETGLNLYLNEQKLKIGLFYHTSYGQAGAAGKGATHNEFFFQNDVGAIRRGNWVGLGLQMML